MVGHGVSVVVLELLRAIQNYFNGIRVLIAIFHSIRYPWKCCGRAWGLSLANTHTPETIENLNRCALRLFIFCI